MSDIHANASVEEIAETLRQRATDLWGAERAEALKAVIEETAGYVRRLAEDAPPVDEVPGTYN